MKTLTITKPDDCHLHLRDGEFLTTTVLHTAERFRRAIIMPNLEQPICTVDQARQYQSAILNALPVDASFQPLMTLYLTDATAPIMIKQAKDSGFIFGCKLYPAGSTTYSSRGVTLIEKLFPVFETMQEVDLPLLLHGEDTDPLTDIFDREAKFLDITLSKLVTTFPDLRIILEHITTKEAVDFVLAGSSNIAATITPHHLLMSRNDLFVGGIRPHHYCLPILKRKTHQDALIGAATSGNPKFFLGTDSAPHAKEKKETACGCAGIYSAHAAIELYCEVFEEAEALDNLEAFSSFFGADFYKLPHNKEKITLCKENWLAPDCYPYATSTLVPLRAGEVIHWKLVNTHE